MNKIGELKWGYYPKTNRTPKVMDDVISAFQNNFNEINSYSHRLKSDQVLSKISGFLINKNFRVEIDKKNKIQIPVLFGEQNVPIKSFQVDAWNEEERAIVEIEAGRALVNNQFLKDIFEASVMIDVDYLAIAVRNLYTGGNRNSKDYDQISKWLDTIYSSNRIQLDLKGILLIGY
mgnify:CR=1 FL=1|jgi:hypothetical protein